MSNSDEERKKREKEERELEDVKKAGQRAWRIHQGKKNKSASNGKPASK